MSLLIFLACLFFLWCGDLKNKVNANTYNYYANHFNFVPKEDVPRLKAQMPAVKKVWESTAYGATANWITNKCAAMYWKPYGGDQLSFEEARSAYLQDQCKAEGVPCDPFVADEITGAYKRRKLRKEGEDRVKYGDDYVWRHRFEYV